MGGINPAIETEAKAAAHAVGVFFITQRAKDHFADIGFVVSIRISKIPDVRNAPGDAARLVLGSMPGQHAGGNIETIRKVGDLIRSAIAIGVFENFDGIATVFDSAAQRVRPSRLIGCVGVFDC